MASSSDQPGGYAPVVPDHRLLRRIGKGSYGEVWLARGVTGVLRAIKIVRRGDFEEERTFEREFEGIRAYEPISRDHRGLVHVLHIGRNDEEGFYYYVMELGDDVQGGPPTNEIEYEPRTLRSDVLRRGRLPVGYCITVGEVLADALGYLHRQGLTHRDIKPSNVIFVGGVPKLADIGLVARSGQRTFVGTQGFTPPEGPGAPQADVYSLGMVLYEVSTGKDRFDFPEVPDELPEEERADWRRLNDVICRACDPEPERRHSDGNALASDLGVLAAGREAPGAGLKWRRPILSAIAVLAAISTILALWPTPPPPPQAVVTQVVAPPAPTTGSVRVFTTPRGAEILIDGESIGQTPQTLDNLPPGSVRFTLRLEGFRSATVEAQITAGEMTVVAHELEFYKPPVPGQPWVNQLGMEFTPSGRNHAGTGPVTWKQFESFADSDGKNLVFERSEWKRPDGQKETIVLATRDTAERFCAWLLQRGRTLGFLGPEHYYAHARSDALPPRTGKDGKELTPFICSVRSFLYGSLMVSSIPEGAEVWELPSRRFLGRTPLAIDRLVPGRQAFEIRLEGHEKQEATVAVKAEEIGRLDVVLRPSKGVIFGKEWKNSLGMGFVPVGDLMVAATETRVSDWQAYRAATGAAAASTSFRQRADEPVAGVSRNDAVAFCVWLTNTERGEGFIQDNHRYRLPTDAEWSSFAGLVEPIDKLPHELDGQNRGVFPWGYEWPPPHNAGNLADETARQRLPRGTAIITGYRDGFIHTAPVATFTPNRWKLHDLAGNVWEWVGDDYGGDPGNPASTWAVCRGGSWADGKRDDLLVSMRNILKADYRGDGLYGFRVVLQREGEVDVAPDLFPLVPVLPQAPPR